MKNHSSFVIGVIYAIIACFIWGISPIYWSYLKDVPPLWGLIYRLVCSSLIGMILLLGFGQYKEFIRFFKSVKKMPAFLLATCFISTHWYGWIWGVNNGHVMEIGLGAFMTPLWLVCWGQLFFKEHLRKGQMLAISIAMIAIIYQVVSFGEVPWIALITSTAFSLYTAIKKKFAIPALISLTLEATLLSPIFLIVGSMQESAWGSFLSTLENPLTTILLICTGILSLTPLLFYFEATKRVPLTVLSIIHYVSPIASIMIAVWYFHEPFTQKEAFTFGCIWTALIIFTLEGFYYRQQRKKQQINNLQGALKSL